MSSNANAVASQSSVTPEEYAALKARYETLLREKANTKSMLKVTAKGSISMYGLSRRFPTTLTKKQWLKVIALVKNGELERFIAANDAILFQGQAAETEQE